ncbi:MAG TPA: serine hydrolase domain-containing protein [Candidatus Acidoferrales bacterium]|nr:serine hydrolase domain-containing protein [Candidatus Acidoferrales bacterium]
MKLAAIARLTAAACASVAFACSIGAGRTAQPAGRVNASVPAALKADLQQYLLSRGDAEHISAASLSVSLADRSTIDVAAGTTRYHGGAAVTPANLFQIGSNTKAFTAVLVLKLQSQGKLNAQQTVGHWLPQYAAWRGATIDRMLHMISGIATYDNTQAWEKDFSADPYHVFSAEQLIGYAVGKPLLKGWNYSNTGYILTQRIIEKSSGSSYEQLLRSDVIAPTNIRDLYYYSSFYPKLLVNRMVAGYYYNDNADDKGLWPILKHDVRGYGVSWAQAAGGIVATPHAVAQWARDLYQGTIVTPAERRQLERLVSTKTAEPLTGVTPSDPGGFGLGVTQIYKKGLGTFWFYEGETLGYRMVHVYFPKQDVVIAFALNSQPNPGQDRVGDLARDLVATLTKYGLFEATAR